MPENPKYVHSQFKCGGKKCPYFILVSAGRQYRPEEGLCKLTGKPVKTGWEEDDDGKPKMGNLAEWCKPARLDLQRIARKDFPQYQEDLPEDVEEVQRKKQTNAKLEYLESTLTKYKEYKAEKPSEWETRSALVGTA